MSVLPISTTRSVVLNSSGSATAAAGTLRASAETRQEIRKGGPPAGGDRIRRTRGGEKTAQPSGRAAPATQCLVPPLRFGEGARGRGLGTGAPPPETSPPRPPSPKRRGGRKSSRAARKSTRYQSPGDGNGVGCGDRIPILSRPHRIGIPCPQKTQRRRPRVARRAPPPPAYFFTRRSTLVLPRRGRDALEREITQRRALGRLREHLGERRVPKRGLHHGDCLVQPLVQRAESHAVRFEAKRARLDAVDWLNRVDHFQDRQILRPLREGNAAAHAALRLYDAATTQRLQHLRQVRRGDPRRVRDLLGRLRFGRGIGQVNHCPQGVLQRL